MLGILAPVGRGLGEVLSLEALNKRISSAFRATVISMANLGIVFSIAFVVLLVPLVVRESSPGPAEGVKA